MATNNYLLKTLLAIKTFVNGFKVFEFFTKNVIYQLAPCALCGCKSDGSNICKDCLASCFACSDKFRITHTKTSYSPWLYSFPINKLLHKFKYQNQQQMASVLGFLITYSLKSNKSKYKNLEAVVAMPMHKNRYKIRQFNHAFILAQAVSKLLKIPIINCIERINYKIPQTQCTGKNNRIENVKNAFKATEKCPKVVLLIDDVITTGATVAEVAKTLKKAGAKEVHALSLCVNQSTPHKV